VALLRPQCQSLLWPAAPPEGDKRPLVRPEDLQLLSLAAGGGTPSQRVRFEVLKGAPVVRLSVSVSRGAAVGVLCFGDAAFPQE
jgi:hypothetical protein